MGDIYGKNEEEIAVGDIGNGKNFHHASTVTPDENMRNVGETIPDGVGEENVLG